MGNATAMITATGTAAARTASAKRIEITAVAVKIDAMGPSAIGTTAVANTAVGTDAAMVHMTNDKVLRGRSTAHPLFMEKNIAAVEEEIAKAKIMDTDAVDLPI